jgi:hypothetical protein
MPTREGFEPGQPVPGFLIEKATQDAGNMSGRVVGPAPALKAGIFIAAAIAVGLAVLAVGHREALVADVSASLAGNSSIQPAPAVQAPADASASIPSTAEAQAVPPAPTEARSEVASSEPVVKDPAENSEPSSETLFRQFQAWAAEQDAQPRGEPAQQVQEAPAQTARNAPSVQDAPARATAKARMPHRVAQKRRQIRAVRNARAEMRVQHLRKQVVRRAPRERAAERPPVQDARAQEQSVQTTQATPFQAIFGPRN